MPSAAAALSTVPDAWRRPAFLAHAARTRAIRVALAHGRHLARADIRRLLDGEPEIAVVGEADSGEDAVGLARRTRPDVVVVDVGLPGLGCVETTRRLLAVPGVAVMVLTPSESDDRVLATLRAGATGVVYEDRWSADLVRAVTRAVTRAAAGDRRRGARSPRAPRRRASAIRQRPRAVLASC